MNTKHKNTEVQNITEAKHLEIEHFNIDVEHLMCSIYCLI